jgi:hypothetical protein
MIARSHCYSDFFFALFKKICYNTCAGNGYDRGMSWIEPGKSVRGQELYKPLQMRHHWSMSAAET